MVLFRLSGEWAIFDTGHYSDRRILLDALTKAGVSVEEIRHAVLSHLHFDHVLNLPLFTNAAIYISRAEMEYADQVLAGRMEDHSIPDFWPSLLENRQVRVVDELLDLSSRVSLVHLPGHTPGCLAMFYEGTSSVAVCGDVIKNAWEAVRGESTMALGGRAAARNSIETVLKRAAVIIPGHDRPFIKKEEGLEFLTPFVWEVRANIYPEKEDRSVLRLNFLAGKARFETRQGR